MAIEEFELIESYYSTDAAGKVTFTEEGARYYRRHFAKSGFNLDLVTDFEDFLDKFLQIKSRICEAVTEEAIRSGELKGNERMFAEGFLEVDVDKMQEAQQNMKDSREMGANVTKLTFGKKK